ncbi:hypothetical protein LTR29_007440 [Friedmanniomyces endolithicus]|nr:hypothetical protein LTR29_007440 [Friedmanniomyces endolithicus]
MSAKVKEGRIGKHEANGRTSKTVKRERVQAALPVPSPSDDASEWEGFSDSEDGGVALELSALMRVGCASDTAEATLKWSESVAIPSGGQAATDALGTGEARVEKYYSLAEARWGKYWLRTFPPRVRPPYDDLGTGRARNMSTTLLHHFAILSYWVRNKIEANGLLLDEVRARLRKYSPGKKTRHATPGDVKAVLMRMVQEGKEGFAGKTWAELADAALR